MQNTIKEKKNGVPPTGVRKTIVIIGVTNQVRSGITVTSWENSI